MTVRAAVSSLEATSRFIAHAPSDRTRLSEAVVGLSAKIDAVDGSNVEDPPSLVMRLMNHWNNVRALDGLTRREVRGAARHLFTQDGDGRRIADDQARLDALLAHPTAVSSSQALKNLAMAYLAGFERATPAAKDALARHILQSATERRVQSLDTWINAGLFDVSKGAQKLAASIISKGAPVAETYETLQYPEMLRAVGLSRAAYRLGCTYVRDTAAQRPVLVETLIDWASLEGDPEHGRVKLRYPAAVGATVDALLLPWAQTTPTGDIERKVRNFVIAAIGDPRFTSSSAQWSEVDDQARSVLTGWLTRASVIQFFEIVSQTMSKPDEKRMWKYRRQFWSAYLPHISNAWVAFGNQGEQLARETANRTGDNSFKQFGQLFGSVAGTHAVLIMTIGDLVIAEWSHSGKCRMWPKGHKDAPKLYDRAYRAENLRWSEWWEASHTGNETYGWQGKFAEKIRRETGLAMKQADYRVRS